MTTLFVVVPREYRFVVRELAGENARNQQPMADLEKEVAFVFCKFDVRVGAGGAGEFFDFVHGLLRNEHFYFAIQSCKFCESVSASASRWPSVATIASVSASGSAGRRSTCTATLPSRSRISFS